MSAMQVVFLFDLNACADFLFSPKEELSRKLLSVRLACLRILSDFSSKYVNLKWGAKFFDSQGSKNQSMCKFVFTDLSLENFETLENEICIRYERHLSILQALLESSPENTSLINNKLEEIDVCSPVKILQLALTQILCEFQWETMDMWSPSYTKIKNRKRNFLILFSDFKDNDELLYKYFGLRNFVSKSKFMNLFLPQSLRDSIVKKADIHFVLLNMCEDIKFMGGSSSKILPLLSEVLHSIHGSFIPLCILSYPLYDLKLLNDIEKNFSQEKEVILSNLSIGYQNSFIPFSTLFEQGLYYSFYSKAGTPLYNSCIDFTSRDIQIPIQVMEISNINPNLSEDTGVKSSNSVKNKRGENFKYTWSKFNVHCAVPRYVHFPASEMLFCLPNSYKSNSSYTCGLQNLNRSLNDQGFSLLLECVSEDGKKLPGFFTSLSCDTAVISIFDLSISLKFGYKFLDCGFSKSQELSKDLLDEIKNFCNKNLNLFDNETVEKVYSVIPKPFKVECLENKFKARNFPHLVSNTSKTSLKMKDYSNLLKQSVANNKNSKSKQTKDHESAFDDVKQGKNTEEKLPDITLSSDAQMKGYEELPSDISFEELLSAIRDAYNSAIESSVSVVTAAKTVMKMMINYCKKHNGTAFEENVSAIFKENFSVIGRRITEKYDTLDSKEAAEKIIKECQIQILLNLELESLMLNNDKLYCINNVTSLLRTAEFYFMYKEMLQLDGLKERRIFLNDVLKKNYDGNMHDILEECIDEFEDSESSVGSPAETISSEFNNEEELFSHSSIISERSSSSSGSCKISSKDAKDKKNTLERKLIRRRSDISDTARCRQVLLPKSSPKKKKAKTVSNKPVRCSPRFATKKIIHNKSTCERTNKARRNLFSGDKDCETPKKIYNQTTPRSKKKIFVSRTKLAAETPCHKQNYSALQRRKSHLDNLSNSPKVIAESPKIRKTAKDHRNKEMLEKLQKAKSFQEASKSSNIAVEQKSRHLSFNDYTPESKRRLSLKLFSKLLISPTARQGIKKCTKRLFDQISPQKSDESCKKFKTSSESKETSYLLEKNETQR